MNQQDLSLPSSVLDMAMLGKLLEQHQPQLLAVSFRQVCKT